MPRQPCPLSVPLAPHACTGGSSSGGITYEVTGPFRS